MPIKQCFAGKRVLLTGTTGFLGKVLLQKFLFSLDQVDKIYVLIRAKQGSNLFQRFKKEIISSPCFDRLRNHHKGKFYDFIQSKVQPIQGDLQKQRLGMDATTYQELVDNCHVIINCAASIDFNASMEYAVDSNIRGSLRMLELARAIKKLDVFTHISTCYVNCDQRGLIKQEIFHKEMDPEQQLKMLQQMSTTELIENTKRILGRYPNTYTYTKNLCERLMQKRKGNVPLCLVRPAIINTSYRQPVPGWIDSIAAAAALFMMVGLGVVTQVKGNVNYIGDIVAVDVVVATIIVATAFNFGTQSLPIYHVGSSDRNPLTWGEMRTVVCDFWNENVSHTKLSKAGCFVTENETLLKLHKMKRSIPIWIYQRLGFLMDNQAKKNAQRMIKTVARGQQVAKIFEFFTTNEWIYECRNFKKLWQFLTPQERKEYLIDVAEIDAKNFITINNYGIQKYILKENVQLDRSNLLNARQKQEKSYFSDLKWAFNIDIPLNRKKKVINEVKTKILASTRVLKAIDDEINNKIQSQQMSMEKAKDATHKQAQKYLRQIVGQVKISIIRSMVWTVHKSFKSMYEKININKDMLECIREIEQTSGIPIVLLPTHRSYLDFLIVSYTFFIYKLRLPNFVADQSLLQANLLPFLFRSSGAFFFQKHLHDKSRLYRIIFDKYVQLLLRANSTLQFFIQGTRSRTGKILAPRFQILNVVLDTLYYGKVPEICLIPMTVNYEKVLQGDTFPGQLLGQEPLQETFMRVLKATLHVRKNMGSVYVQICAPMMAREFTDNLKEIQRRKGGPTQGAQFRRYILDEVGREIILRMTNGVVIVSTAVVSAILLMHRKGISQDDLVKMVNELVKYILQKGYKVGGINESSSAVAVRNAISHLSGITSKSKKNIFELTFSADKQFQKILMLSYYRNTLTHAFLPEAFLGCVFAAFGEQITTVDGVPLERVHQLALFLMRLLKNQYYIVYSLEKVDFLRVIDQMKDNSIIQIRSQDKVVVAKQGLRMIAFYCSLLRSQIEIYWASLVYIITISHSAQRKYQAASLNKFFATVQWFMQSLYSQKVIQDYQACSLESIKNAFQKYENQKIIRISGGSRKKDSCVVEVLVPQEELDSLENKIKFFRKSVNNSVISPREMARSSLKQFTMPRL